VYDKKRRSEDKKGNCLFALALHIVGNLTWICKYGMYMLWTGPNGQVMSNRRRNSAKEMT